MSGVKRGRARLDVCVRQFHAAVSGVAERGFLFGHYEERRDNLRAMSGGLVPAGLTAAGLAGNLAGMSTDLRDRANARLDAALRDRELSDPRDGYRTRLRVLRETRAELFERAARHYEAEVLPALAAGGDAIDAWIDYGRFLAEMITPGRVLTIDATGSAQPYSAPLPAHALVLHLPFDHDAAAMPLTEPLEPSVAQRAAYDLLVRGKLALEVPSP